MSTEELTFEKLQELKDEKKKCQDNLKGEDIIIKAEKALVKLETKIFDTLKALQSLQVKKADIAAVASGRAGIENCKLIIKDLETRIPELEKVLKAQTG